MPRKNSFTRNIDKAIGKKIHELRITMGLSMQQLSAKIGVTHQQLQKYENGKNCISVGRLVSIAKALGKPTTFFVEDIEKPQTSLPSIHQTMCIEVARNFMRMKSPTHQNVVSLLVRALANN